MTADPVTIKDTESLLSATRILKERKFKHLPVIDGTGALVGIVTDRDLKRASASDATTLEVHELLYLLDQVRIERVMTANPASIGSGDDVSQAAQVMVDRRIGCLPVMDGGKLVGIVTKHDLLRLIASGKAGGSA